MRATLTITPPITSIMERYIVLVHIVLKKSYWTHTNTDFQHNTDSRFVHTTVQYQHSNVN